jgi:hypothetical protein
MSRRFATLFIALLFAVSISGCGGSSVTGKHSHFDKPQSIPPEAPQSK